MAKKLKYILEKSPKKKGTCPECKQEKAFRYYEGQPREFGICDRVNNCGYHNYPNSEQIVNLPIPETKEKEVKTIYPTLSLFNKIMDNDSSSFHTYCDRLGINDRHLRAWQVGTIEQKTAFCYSDKLFHFLNVVHISYNENGKRNKKIFPYSLKAKEGEKYNLCLFGEHLLTDKIVCLVESEKTAVIASFFYPQFDWLATGGANKLTDEKISVLFGRKILYLNDADKAGKENSTIKKLKAYKQDFTIIDLFPDRNDGYDLADAIGEGKHPEIVESETDDTETSEDEYFIPEETQKINQFDIVEKFLTKRYEIRYNKVGNEVEFRPAKTKDPFKQLNENNIYIRLQKNYINFSQAKVTALLSSDFVEEYDPFESYFENLPKWKESDGDHILKLCNYISVHSSDRERLERQFKKMLVRCIACSLLPGVFNKQSFILVHDQQNSGKSTFVRWLCPPELSEYITENISTDKDSLIALSGNFIINMDELATLNKAEINTLKAMMSKDVIKVRHPFGKKPMLTPRRANFFGSTNKSEFLSDETGSVRWICFELIDKLNFEYKDDIDINNIWGQAYTLFKQGFKYELTQDEIKENERANNTYQIITEEQELIQKCFEPSDKEHSSVFLQASDFKQIIAEKYPFVKLNIINLGRALKMLGFKKESQRNEKHGYPIKGYYVTRTGETGQLPADYNSQPETKPDVKNIVGAEQLTIEDKPY